MPGHILVLLPADCAAGLLGELEAKEEDLAVGHRPSLPRKWYLQGTGAGWICCGEMGAGMGREWSEEGGLVASLCSA